MSRGEQAYQKQGKTTSTEINHKQHLRVGVGVGGRREPSSTKTIQIFHPVERGLTHRFENGQDYAGEGQMRGSDNKMYILYLVVLCVP